MQSKFTGTWRDQREHRAFIAGENGQVTVEYAPEVGRPGQFPGTEQNPAIAPAFIDVNFTDVNQTIRGTLQNDGHLIVWNNGTLWVRVTAEAAGA